MAAEEAAAEEWQKTQGKTRLKYGIYGRTWCIGDAKTPGVYGTLMFVKCYLSIS